MGVNREIKKKKDLKKSNFLEIGGKPGHAIADRKLH